MRSSSMPPDDLLRNLSLDPEKAFVELVNRLDKWVSGVGYNDHDHAREIYGEVICAFVDEKNIEKFENERRNFSSVSSWWEEFYKELMRLKARFIFRLSGEHTASPNTDLPDDIKADYEEARSILLLSPRGAAALLRLAVQKICKGLGQPGKNLNDDIESLFRGGLPEPVMQALHSVRVMGNNAVHPGQIQLTEDVSRVANLFMAVNYIADKTFSETRRIQEIFNALPERDRAAIEKHHERAKKS